MELLQEILEEILVAIVFLVLSVRRGYTKICMEKENKSM